MKFNFPATIFVETNTELQQLHKIVSEFNELLEELLRIDNPEILTTDSRVSEELMDLTCALETLWRIKIKQNPDAVANTLAYVLIKNWKRKYFGDVIIGESVEPIELFLIQRIHDLENEIDTLKNRLLNIK